MKRVIVVFIAGLLMGSISTNVPKTFTGSVNSTNAQAVAIWKKVENMTCTQFDTVYGLTGGTCATMMDPCIDRTVVSFQCNNDTGNTNWSVTFDPAGQFSVTVP